MTAATYVQTAFVLISVVVLHKPCNIVGRQADDKSPHILYQITFHLHARGCDKCVHAKIEFLPKNLSQEHFICILYN